MVKRVLDTNVIVKWFLPEEDGVDRARVMFDDMDRGAVRFVVPSFFHHEFSSILWVKRREGLLEDRAADVWEKMVRLPLEVVDAFELIPEALSLGFRYNVSPYDGIFVVLARVLGCELITADFPLWSKVRTACPWVKRL